jgi:hypothetical protein
LRESRPTSRPANYRRSVWVPAYAGTTAEFADLLFKQPKAFPRLDFARVV